MEVVGGFQRVVDDSVGRERERFGTCRGLNLKGALNSGQCTKEL